MRRKAAEELGGLPEPWAGGELVRLLADAHAPVRDTARAGLLRQGLAAAPALFRGLDHSDPKIAATAAELLGEVRPAGGVERLLTVLKFGARPVRVAAVRALAHYGSAARPAIQAELDGADPWVRAHLNELLAAPADAALPTAPVPGPVTQPGADVAAGWPALAAAPERFPKSDALPIGRSADNWGLAIMLMIAVIVLVAVVASFR
ncbi:MAG TPA: HEAT repeat domain-containing protein [Gemmataceae bacterium]|nr:HEAT repeat domain-containing protein [Gemmataceae bacterium]